MGKFDFRDKVHGEGSYENHSSSSFSGKALHRNKKISRSRPYFSDPLLIPRINQYLAEHKEKVYVDINDMVSGLQSRYKEYARRKRNVFRQSVQKAFATVLEQCRIDQVMGVQDDEYVGSTENSSSEVEECNIHDTEEKSPRQSAELIDLSSDDENIKKKDAEEENIASDVKKISHSVSAGSAEKVFTVARKRKHATYSEKMHSHTSKQRKFSSFQEPKVTFGDFGGNSKVLEEVCKLILHIQHPELYRQMGLSSPRGILLHGPPGCGKTLLAAAIAGELEVHFLKVSAPELVGGVSGESEERIRDLFESAVECAPCVLFIDEVDAITPNRQNAQREMERRIVAQLLTCMDELGNTPNGDQVLVIGATNIPDALDPALRRAGRFDREVCLGIPDLRAREQILRVVCKNLKMSPNFSYEAIALNTPGFVGADLVALTREAAMTAINRVFGSLHHHYEDERSKIKRIKTVTKESSKSKSNKLEHSNPHCDKSKNGLHNAMGPGIMENKTGELKVCNKCENRCNEKEIDEGGEMKENLLKECTSGSNEKDKESVDCLIDENEFDNECTKVKGKEMGSEKDESDMDIAETVSDESVNCDVNDIEICKDESVKTVDSEDQSEVEMLPKHNVSATPCLETLLSWIRCTSPIPLNELEKVYLTQDDFKRALRSVQPSAKREGFATVPDVTWDDVGSLTQIREELKMSILGPVKMRKQFEQLGLTAPSGILICGPPGCGKTLLAKAVANEAGINFISVKGPELLNMYVGESERAVRQCFQRARNSAPCVIFFDELDALCPKRSTSGENGASMRVVNQMLTEMDGVEDRKEVYLMAASNRPDIVDPAVLRPGRLDKILYVGLPDEDDRVDILRALTKNGTRPKLAAGVNLTDIATRPECTGYSGADLAALVREAGVQALKDLAEKPGFTSESDVAISLEHFERALKLVRRSVSREDLKYYDSLREKYCCST